MSKTDINDIIRNHAMLVSIHLRHWPAQTKDNEAAKAAAVASGAAGNGAFRAIKNLMHQNDGRLKAVATAGAQARQLHMSMTMAWDTGKSPHRMLPIVQFGPYSQAISVAKTHYEDVLQDFMNHYEDDARKARIALNLPEDGHTLRMYPRVGDDLKSRFGLALEFEPIAEGAVFGNLPATVAGALTQSFEDRVTRRYRESLEDAYDRIHGLMDVLLTNLNTEPTDRAARWKDSSVTNIVEAGKMLSTFDLESDPAHTEFCELVESSLGDYGKTEMTMLRKPGSVDERQAVIDDVASLQVMLETMRHE